MSELKDILTLVPLTFLDLSAEWEERREEESPSTWTLPTVM